MLNYFPCICANTVSHNNYNHAASWISVFPFKDRKIEVRDKKQVRQDHTAIYMSEKGLKLQTGDVHSAVFPCGPLEALNR